MFIVQVDGSFLNAKGKEWDKEDGTTEKMQWKRKAAALWFGKNVSRGHGKKQMLVRVGLVTVRE